MLEQQTIFEFGRIQTPQDWLVFGLGLVGLLAATAWLYKRDTIELPRRYAIVLTLLRCGVLLLAFVVFLDPRWRVETIVEQPSRVAVLLDDSASMTIEDATQPDESTSAKSRLQVLKDCLSSTPLLRTLRQTHELEIFSLGKDLRSVASFARSDSADNTSTASGGEADWLTLLEGSQQETRLGDAVDSILKRKQVGTLAGMLVITDGNNNAGQAVELAAKSAADAQVPVATVGIGRESAAHNLRVADLQAPSRAFRGDEMPVVGYVQYSGETSAAVTVSLLIANAQADDQPVVVEKKEITLDGGSPPQQVEFRYVPDKSGSWRLTVQASGGGPELVDDDNQMSATFEVVDQQTKVLLFAGGPTRDYRFLRALLYRDESMETSVYLQSSPEAVAQDADHVLMEFPRTRDELFQYDLIIGFDPNWGELHPDARELLVEWVSKQAGGLIVVAGPIHSPLLPRNSSLKPILQIFPIVFKELILADTGSESEGGPWPVRFTPEGEASEFLAFADDRASSQKVWEQFEGVYSAFPIQSVKPGATVLAELSNPRASLSAGSAPLFVSHYYGAGRVLYIGTSELWRLRRLGEKYYDRLWIQSIRHFAQGRLLRGASRGSLLLDVDRVALGELIAVRARILDAELRPAQLPNVAVSVVNTAGDTSQLQLQPEGVPGQFRADFIPRTPGEYLFQMLIPNSDELVERRIQVVLPDLERQSLQQDRRTLEKLALDTKGRYFTPDDLDAIPSVFEDRSETTILSGTPIPLWDRWYLMLGCILLLSTEWLIRKLLFLA